MEFPLAEFERVKDDLRPVIEETPMQYSQTFSSWAGSRIFLKPECLQKNGSFKIRGAYNALKSLTDDERKRGVVTCSAGNWAQGVAYGSKLLGMKALVVMPNHVSKTKLEATRSYGADVLLHGSTSTELFRKAKELSAERNMTYLHAFDEPAMIVGHGTVGIEILEEQPDTDVIVVPVGGGALISGIALAAKQLSPNVKIYGVQPSGAAAMYASLKEGRVIEIDRVETIAEGLAVKRSGERTFHIVKEYVEEIVLVSEDEIKSAVLLLLERAKLLAEPSGAVPLAAVLRGKIRTMGTNTKVVLVLSGGNIDLPVLKKLLPS